MRFQPKTEDELKRARLLKEGEGDFTVRAAAEERSDAGNDMIHLTLDVWDTDGQQAMIHDYLVEAMGLKFRHFCYATGLEMEYEAGTLAAEECVGKGGRLSIRTEQDKAKKYPPKSVVSDYLAHAVKPAPRQAAAPSAGSITQAEQAKRDAWTAFKRAHPTFEPQIMQNEFKSAAKMYMPGKPTEHWTAEDFNRFVGDGFIRRVENPIGTDAIFTTDDPNDPNYVPF